MSDVISTTELSVMADEPRVMDTRLASALGMKRATNIREKIIRNRMELEGFGPVHETRALVDRPQGGTVNAQTYYLNEPQALLLCMWARTPTAAAVRKQLIEVFMAWRRAQAEQQPAIATDTPTIPVKAHERRTSTPIDKAISLARSADRLEAVANLIQPQQASLAWVDGTPVPYDASDYKLHGQEAVVLYQDGRVAVEVVEYRHGDSPRAGYTKPRPWTHGGTMRMGVTILGRVMPRAVPPGAVQSITRHGPRPIYREAILAGLDQGMTAREVAAQTGASIWTVRDWQRKRRLLAA